MKAPRNDLHLEGLEEMQYFGVVKSYPLSQPVNCGLDEDIPFEVPERAAVASDSVPPIFLDEDMAFLERLLVVPNDLIKGRRIPSQSRSVVALLSERVRRLVDNARQDVEVLSEASHVSAEFSVLPCCSRLVTMKGDLEPS
jgi:hypothetical protein